MAKTCSFPSRPTQPNYSPCTTRREHLVLGEISLCVWRHINTVIIMPQQNRSHLIPTTGLLHTHYEVPCRHNVPPTPTTSLSSHGQGKDNIFWLFRATLDEGPRSRDQWIQIILLVKSFKFVPRPLDKGPRLKSGKLRLNLHGTCFGGKDQLVWTKEQC
jgi:hypothetical protein